MCVIYISMYAIVYLTVPENDHEGQNLFFATRIFVTFIMALFSQLNISVNFIKYQVYISHQAMRVVYFIAWGLYRTTTMIIKMFCMSVTVTAM